MLGKVVPMAGSGRREVEDAEGGGGGRGRGSESGDAAVSMAGGVRCVLELSVARVSKSEFQGRGIARTRETSERERRRGPGRVRAQNSFCSENHSVKARELIDTAARCSSSVNPSLYILYESPLPRSACSLFSPSYSHLLVRSHLSHSCLPTSKRLY